MKTKYIVLLILISCISVFPQSPKINFVEYDLANGLHIILHQDNSNPIIAVTVTYHVGSKNEQSDRTGFAHFFEHLMFEGSEYIKRGEFDKIVQNAGGNSNAFTSFDQTGYFLEFPSNQLELALWLESERMLHAKIDSVGVETQRNVVKEERRLRYDNQPYGTLMENIFKYSYTVHPYHWTPIGSLQYIDNAKIDEFKDFYKTFYVPNNAVLSIAGDIDINKTKELINKYFNDIPKGKKEIYRPNVVEPQKTSEVREVVYDNIQLPLVAQAYHIPAQGTDDYYALTMLTNLLSSGESSRLYKELVDNKKLALTVNSFPMSLEDPGLFMTYAIANAGVSADTLEKAIDEEIQKVKDNLISENEFTKLKNQIESSFINDKNEVLNIAFSLANYYLFFNDTNLINTELDRYNKVTREDIKSVANKYLTKENRTVLYYLPKKSNL